MQLQNNGHVKRLFNGYIKGHTSTTKSSKSYVRTPFIPFTDERDHLGHLRYSDAHSDFGVGGPLVHYANSFLPEDSLPIRIKNTFSRQKQQMAHLSGTQSMGVVAHRQARNY